MVSWLAFPCHSPNDPVWSFLGLACYDYFFSLVYSSLLPHYRSTHLSLTKPKAPNCPVGVNVSVIGCLLALSPVIADSTDTKKKMRFIIT